MLLSLSAVFLIFKRMRRSRGSDVIDRSSQWQAAPFGFKALAEVIEPDIGLGCMLPAASASERYSTK